MFKYILKRLLLMIPTFIGATLLVFLILALVPGGPFEKAVFQLQAAQMSSGEGGGGSSSVEGSNQLSTEVLDQLRRQYGLDKPLMVRYLIWLGLYPREIKGKKIAYNKPFRENLEYFKTGERSRTYELQRWVRVRKEGDKEIIEVSGVGTDFKVSEGPYSKFPELPFADAIPNWYPNDEWKIREVMDVYEVKDTSVNVSKNIEVNKDFEKSFFTKSTETLEIQEDGKAEGYNKVTWVRVTRENGKLKTEEGVVTSRISRDGEKVSTHLVQSDGSIKKVPYERDKQLYDYITEWKPANNWQIAVTEKLANPTQTAFSGIFTGDFGTSYVYDQPVLSLIRERLPISMYFGIIGFLLTYLICIPLGIMKAVRHNTPFDFVSSAIVFMGYAVPGYAFGALMLVLFGGGTFMDIFPLGGFHSPTEVWEKMTFIQKVADQLHHTFLPVLSYMLGSFAFLTILMKNSLMDNLGQDYIRTAFAKGLDEKKVIYLHAVRNSLIPLATGIGGIIGLFLAGSYLIELVFNIDGIGKLGFEAIVSVDYPVFLGFLVLFIIVRLFGNLISDMCYVAVDPRIKFD
ncbi:MAG: ABC transporter permease subunit [Chitinophagales bacterium]